MAGAMTIGVTIGMTRGVQIKDKTIITTEIDTTIALIIIIVATVQQVREVKFENKNIPFWAIDTSTTALCASSIWHHNNPFFSIHPSYCLLHMNDKGGRGFLILIYSIN